MSLIKFTARFVNLNHYLFSAFFSIQKFIVFSISVLSEKNNLIKIILYLQNLILYTFRLFNLVYNSHQRYFRYINICRVQRLCNIYCTYMYNIYIVHIKATLHNYIYTLCHDICSISRVE